MIFYLIAKDAEGNEWKVFPDIDLNTMSWSYVVPDGAYLEVAGHSVRTGDKLSGRLELA